MKFVDEYRDQAKAEGLAQAIARSFLADIPGRLDAAYRGGRSASAGGLRGAAGGLVSAPPSFFENREPPR